MRRDNRFRKTKEELIQEIEYLKKLQADSHPINLTCMTTTVAQKYWDEKQRKIDRLEHKLQRAS